MIKQFISILFIIAALSACTHSKQQTMSHEYTNDLIHETSPYLLQHAHNPVDWKAWNDKALNEAQDSNKLILISVGYSSCHWCHVMEHESFEDTLVASVMNKHFINIKVDREERPDVDQVYMNAVQLMTGSGGWPLNVVALPDGRPVWGGTYFRKEAWIKALEQIAEVYRESPERLVEYADRLEQGIKSIDIVDLNPDKPEFHIDSVNQVVVDWSKQFDLKLGGPSRAPKFMMPSNLHFLLRYAHQTGNDSIMDYVNLTLAKMAFGGVFDQLGGGFSRYSVDTKWHIPHFEKMLYDNGQLVSLYSDAYLMTGNPLYAETVYKTLEFIERELTDADGSFYSSLDADSMTADGELEEGAFYVWTEEELRNALQEDFDLFAAYYNINDYGYWEKDNYVLIRNQEDKTFIEANNLSVEDFSAKRKAWRDTLLQLREKRDRPRLDDKALTSWNALMLKGYADAYRVFGKKEYIDTALKNANFIRKIQIRDDGGLNHSFKDGKSTINGYLEDYAAVIDAFLALYEITLDQLWLDTSRNLANYAFDHFYDDSSKMFFFTSNEDRSLVVRNIEYRDNVIPASNSIMAKNLFKLSHYFDNQAYYNNATAMLNNVNPEIHTYPSGFSNWLDLMLNYTNNYYEVAVVGNEAKSLIKEMNTNYLPNILIVGSEASNDLPLLKNRYVEGETFVYVCVNKTCKLPVKEIEEALKLIDK